MVIREIQMISNTYGSERQGTEHALGRYCVFGPFDAMDIAGEVQQWNRNSGNERWEDLEKKLAIELSGYDGKSNRCKVSCIFLENEEEKNFIERLKGYPFLFVSFLLLRHKHNGDEMTLEDVKSVIRGINIERDVRIYLSLDKNELILLHYCNSFLEGFDTVARYHGRFKLSKTSTIFAAQERALDLQDTLYEKINHNEEVSCRLRCIVKEYSKADNFIKKLRKLIMEKSEGQAEFKCYNMVGENDILIEINKFRFADLLTFYKTKELLTHMNPEYSAAWFNIETELISERKT